jgi:hypothetical protein
MLCHVVPALRHKERTMSRKTAEAGSIDEYAVMIRTAALLQAQAEKLGRDAKRLLEKNRRAAKRAADRAALAMADA